KLDDLKKDFRAFPEGVEPPETYVATLRLGIARRAVGKTDGLLLNFCSPQHAAGLTEVVKPQLVSSIEFACYLKVFYASEGDAAARRRLVQEFLTHDPTPPDHETFFHAVTSI